MITWGISANSHDAALAVFDNQRLLFASHSERFSGIKNDAHLNDKLICAAREYGEPDSVVWYERPLKKTFRQFWAGQGWNYEENNIKRYLKDHGIHAPVSFADHHHSHAAAGYYISSFDNATVVCVDSIGEWETLTVWRAKGRVLKKVLTQGYPHSVGLWYSAMTQRVGLKPNEDEYILMGMAAYGDPARLYSDVRDMVIVNHRDELFAKADEVPFIHFKQNHHRGCMDWRPDLTTEQDMYDIAAATQMVYEELLDDILLWASEETSSRNLVLMGGCALNCSANSIAYKYFDNVWIMPNPGDAGSAVGAVLAKQRNHINWPGPYLGYNIQGEYPVEDVLEELMRTGICGVASGPAEYGPRALGNRSLLADPRGNDIKDRVNDIKQRQRFRPFAPAILAEHYDDYFTGPAGPYMQYTARCLRPDLYPAIVHVDGTSRVQTVSKTDNPGFRKLLEAWYDRTGCPMLLNTSLNIKGKPMVNDLTDAAEFAKMYEVKVYS
jgi:carbamoyltransferase